MSNSSAGTSSKSKVGSSQPVETSFKRKRGVFQKDCKPVPNFLLCRLFFLGWFFPFFFLFFYLFLSLLDDTVQHMMYGFGDDPNVSSTISELFTYNGLCGLSTVEFVIHTLIVR